MATEATQLARDVLPIVDGLHRGLVTFDAKDPDTKFSPIVPLRPPAGAPNILLILLDDVGSVQPAHSAARVPRRQQSG